MDVHICQTCQTVHFKYAQFVVCQLYLHKGGKKQNIHLAWRGRVELASESMEAETLMPLGLTFSHLTSLYRSSSLSVPVEAQGLALLSGITQNKPWRVAK